jgi:glutathione S-transferase
MTKRLENKVAVITGGNSGIGLATAKAYKAEGATVIITARSEESFKKAQSEFGDHFDIVKYGYYKQELIKFYKDKKMKNKLISFALCPFVQRSTITMNYKKVDYDIEYIDLANKPDWFLKISPLGKVPVLQVGDEVLFESAVINEYVDEISNDSLHSKDPLVKAKERAFIELASATTFNYFQGVSATTQENYVPHKELFEKNFGRILDEFKGPYFRGEEFSLVDTSVIPLIQRLFLSKSFVEDINLSKDQRTKLSQWAESTLTLEAVKNSVPKGFEQDYNSYLTNKESYIHLK